MTTARPRRAAFWAAVTGAVTLTAPGCSAQPAEPTVGMTPGTTISPTSTGTAEPAPSLAAAIRMWEAKAGEHFTESGTALQQVSEASAAEDEAALLAGCRRLHDANTIGLQRDLPTPDPHLTAELQRMIDDVNIAAHACVRFVLARDSVDATTYQDYLARAVAHLHRAKTILDADLQPK